MKKWIFALIWSVLPSLFVIFTTPFVQLFDHITHILLFAGIGLAMGIYSLRNELKDVKMRERRWKILPSCSTVIFLVLFGFLATYLMPCPYMFSAHTAQTIVDHPCSQPMTACTAVISFVPFAIHIQPLVFVTPTVSDSTPARTPDNKAPPVV